MLFQQSDRTNGSQAFKFDFVIVLGDLRHCPCAFFACSFGAFVWVGFFGKFAKTIMDTSTK